MVCGPRTCWESESGSGSFSPDSVNFLVGRLVTGRAAGVKTEVEAEGPESGRRNNVHKALAGCLGTSSSGDCSITMGSSRVWPTEPGWDRGLERLGVERPESVRGSEEDTSGTTSGSESRTIISSIGEESRKFWSELLSCLCGF